MTWSLGSKRGAPDGLWMKCEACDNLVYKKVVEDAHHVCPECGFHFRISAAKRIEYLLDDGSFVEHFSNLESVDALNFKGQKSYKDKLLKAQKNTGQREAAVFGTGAIAGQKVVFGVIDANFIMGSMGSVVGEKIARGAELARKEKLPFIVVSGSGGGARMEEGILSLFQMAKTSAAIKRLQDAGGIYIAILTNATMGGSMASWASLGDITIAEPKALLGFAGPRVIAQTVRQELPAGFQTSEFLLDHGFVDMVVARKELRQKLISLLRYTCREMPAFVKQSGRHTSKVEAPKVVSR
ncbi:acetyl-CoA carboxylase carboxyltransferase subunit beta [bacterium]|nr:MAG: acetyl-CoA carboxylase carboxyltransferase subunit beta [bacterium]RIK64604.1 MAG: acetyl-CoA carboxylase carboxyl transferase subunit beta [Planctomycetota bacterium]